MGQKFTQAAKCCHAERDEFDPDRLSGNMSDVDFEEGDFERFAGGSDALSQSESDFFSPPYKSKSPSANGLLGLPDTVAEALSPSSYPRLVTTASSPHLITYVNPAWRTVAGYAFSEAQGKLVKLLEGPMTDLYLLAAMMDKATKAKISKEEMIFYRKDGHRFRIYLVLAPLKDELGEIVAILGEFRKLGAKNYISPPQSDYKATSKGFGKLPPPPLCLSSGDEELRVPKRITKLRLPGHSFVYSWNSPSSNPADLANSPNGRKKKKRERRRRSRRSNRRTSPIRTTPLYLPRSPLGSPIRSRKSSPIRSHKSSPSKSSPKGSRRASPTESRRASPTGSRRASPTGSGLKRISHKSIQDLEAEYEERKAKEAKEMERTGRRESKENNFLKSGMSSPSEGYYPAMRPPTTMSFSANRNRYSTMNRAEQQGTRPFSPECSRSSQRVLSPQASFRLDSSRSSQRLLSPQVTFRLDSSRSSSRGIRLSSPEPGVGPVTNPPEESPRLALGPPSPARERARARRLSKARESGSLRPIRRRKSKRASRTAGTKRHKRKTAHDGATQEATSQTVEQH